MSLPIVYLRAARAEFDEAHDWLEQQRAGKGDEFSERVHEMLDLVATLPELHQCVYKDVRRAVVRKFSYNVYYRAEPNRIVVVSVFHTSRDPSIWQKRV